MAPGRNFCEPAATSAREALKHSEMFYACSQSLAGYSALKPLKSIIS